jgi:endonuclease YncB( thermonuclease family)
VTTLFLALLLAAAVPTSPIYGTAVAGDGDSLTVGGRRVRLFGIDAPEFDQRCTREGQSWACGTAAADELAKLVTGRDVRCSPVGIDRFARVLARCTAGQVDINRVMVASGYAVAFRRYSTDYVSAEDSARVNRRGIWAGTFEMPQAYRHENDDPSPRRSGSRHSKAITTRQVSVAGSCNIKGNQSRRGEWIYHVPGMPYYAQTRAEQIFCSEADAREAGYRRARSQ